MKIAQFQYLYKLPNKQRVHFEVTYFNLKKNCHKILFNMGWTESVLFNTTSLPSIREILLEPLLLLVPLHLAESPTHALSHLSLCLQKKEYFQ